MNAVLKKIAYTLAGLIMVGLAGMILFGRHGYFDYLALQQRQQRIVMDNRLLKTTNAELRRRITRLKSDSEYIAHIARQELGMVEKGEVIYLYRSRGKQP